MAENKGSSVFKEIFKQLGDEIIIPKTKEIVNNAFVETIYMISDFAAKSIGELIFGKGQAPKNNRIRKNPEAYSNVSRNQNQQVPFSEPNGIRTRQSTNLQYVCFLTYQDAERIRKELLDRLYKYDKVRVSDLYECTSRTDEHDNYIAFTQITPSQSDYSYGWTHADDIHFVTDRNGYWFNMPRPVRLMR